MRLHVNNKLSSPFSFLSELGNWAPSPVFGLHPTLKGSVEKDFILQLFKDLLCATYCVAFFFNL